MVALQNPRAFGAFCQNTGGVVYSVVMMGKTATRSNRRRTTSVPVTTMEEIPVLSDQERADLVASLKQAEARVRAGKAVDYDPKAFKKRLLDIYRGAKR
jgi:hypothetical protein